MLTFKGIRYRPTRSWLTILGIIIGIMLVVIILTLSGGIRNAVTRTLQMFGGNAIMIFPGEETNPIAGFIGGQKFKLRDIMDLEDIEGVEYVIPMDTPVVAVEYKGEKKSIMAHANPWKNVQDAYEVAQGFRLEKGVWPTDDQAREVVLGYGAANNLFKTSVNLGDEIIIKSKRMKVVGTVSRVGEQMSDNLVYISMEIYREMTGTAKGANSAFVKAKEDADLNLVAKQIEHQLSKQEVVRDFSVLTPDKADRLIGNVLSIVEIFLLAIAFVSLLVGSVGIMNTMYTSVLERTRQIGVMKSIGATSDAVMSLFLIESGLIGFVGGVLGLITGILAAYLIGLIAGAFGVRGLFSFAAIDFFGLFAVLIFTFIVGVLAGAFPARKAAKMEPAEALRYE